MISRGLSRLGGSIAFDWNKKGLIVTLRMQKARLAGERPLS